MNKKIYVIDTCALINAFKLYPMNLLPFESVWNKISTLFEEGKLISSSEIFEEVKDEELKKWLMKYKKSFLPLSKDI